MTSLQLLYRLVALMAPELGLPESHLIVPHLSFQLEKQEKMDSFSKAPVF